VTLRGLFSAVKESYGIHGRAREAARCEFACSVQKLLPSTPGFAAAG
jgi:hypothetical protein